jgi:hypothetical protein
MMILRLNNHCWFGGIPFEKGTIVVVLVPGRKRQWGKLTGVYLLPTGQVLGQNSVSVLIEHRHLSKL